MAMNNKLQKLLDICKGRMYSYRSDNLVYDDEYERVNDNHKKANVYQEIVLEIESLMKEDE
jgi:hypothetical protein